MTVVVGYLAGKSGTAPAPGRRDGPHLGSSLTVMTIVPRPWTSPSPSRVDAEYTSWAEQLAADSAREAQRFFAALPDPVPVTYLSHAHRSVSGGLIEAVADIDAEVLVLGSSANGGLGQVVVGSTADRMLHSSPVPVAIAPRGYREPSGGRLTRVTWVPRHQGVGGGFAGSALAAQLGVRLRVITFAVRGGFMYPGGRPARRRLGPGRLGGAGPRDADKAAHRRRGRQGRAVAGGQRQRLGPGLDDAGVGGRRDSRPGNVATR